MSSCPAHSTEASSACVHETFEAAASSASARSHLLAHEHPEDVVGVDLHSATGATSRHAVEGELHSAWHSAHAAHTAEGIASTTAWVVRVHSQVVLLSLLFVGEDIFRLVNLLEHLICFVPLVFVGLSMPVGMPFSGEFLIRLAYISL